MELAGQPMHAPQHIYGIDFSGAQDAGKKIWIAESVVKTDSFLIEDCFRARDLLGSGNKLDKYLPTYPKQSCMCVANAKACTQKTLDY